MPIISESWKYSASQDKGKQIKLLSELMNRNNVDIIINAYGAGRDGELIFRLVYNYCKYDKDVKRLWIFSMEEIAVSEVFNNFKPSIQYDNLYVNIAQYTKG